MGRSTYFIDKSYRNIDVVYTFFHRNFEITTCFLRQRLLINGLKKSKAFQKKNQLKICS